MVGKITHCRGETENKPKFVHYLINVCVLSTGGNRKAQESCHDYVKEPYILLCFLDLPGIQKSK